MANHKRGKPKNQRSGCLFCKPWKANGGKNKRPATYIRDTQLEGEEVDEAIQEWYADDNWDSDPYDLWEYVEYLKEYNVK